MKKRNKRYLQLQKETRQWCNACNIDTYNLVEKLKIKKGGKLAASVFSYYNHPCANLEYWQMS